MFKICPFFTKRDSQQYAYCDDGFVIVSNDVNLMSSEGVSAQMRSAVPCAAWKKSKICGGNLAGRCLLIRE